ncbi:DUF4169 family protein [Microbaculum marinum]|uniref:DUF4169 family protein n=1 Tax=Microbaculum marinum TaxID=1764581 RepID=A0AAW9RKQ7_9HYPH
MAEIVNLNKARKEKTRADEKSKAAENRVRFGRRKSDKRVDEARQEKAVRDLAGHRLLPDDQE